MPLEHRDNSGIVLFSLGGFRLAVKLTSFCDPEHVRLALRKACSHERSIVVSRPRTYVGNCIKHLLSPSKSILEVYPLASAAAETALMMEKNDELSSAWFYRLTMETLPSRSGIGPVISWTEMRNGAGQMQVQGLFTFLGNEWKRPRQMPKAYIGKPRGRKPGLRGRKGMKYEKAPEVISAIPGFKPPPGELINARVRRLGPKRLRVNFATAERDRAWAESHPVDDSNELDQDTSIQD